MKKSILCMLLMVMTVGAIAQSPDRKWNLGLLGGTTQYKGDLGNQFLAFDQNTLDESFTYGLNLSRYLNPSFDFSVLGTYGKWGYYEEETPSFEAEMLNFDASVKYKFYNGYMLKETSLFQPYILAGIGVARFQGSRTVEDIDFPLVAGVGLNFRVNGVIGLGYQGTYGYILKSDKFDLQTENDMNDEFLMHTISLNFNLGKAPDADGDGVSDKKDKCADTSLSAEVDKNGCPLDKDNDGVADYVDSCPAEFGVVNGCPDNDKDGVANGNDQCPDVAGLEALSGCPDADGDGVTDAKDECINIKGVLAFAGCPDTDEDGIKDGDDLCPDVRGVKLFSGCPDVDEDNIPDSKDMCPSVKGPEATNGCPDTDMDGVHDGIDKCPTISGVSANEGCPAVKKEVETLLKKALQGIKFQTGKSTIIATSFPILNSVATMMAENPSYKLLIGGHTDNVGSESGNITLSQNRADAVGAYLIGKGVSPIRITSTGYGAAKPVDDNKTGAGRTRNRRVELNVEFMEKGEAVK